MSVQHLVVVDCFVVVGCVVLWCNLVSWSFVYAHYTYVRTYKCTNSVMQVNECAVAESELSGLPPGRVRRVGAYCVCNAYYVCRGETRDDVSICMILIWVAWKHPHIPSIWAVIMS